LTAGGAAPIGTAASWVYDPWHERPRVAAAALLSAVALCALVVAAREPFVMSVALCAFCIAAFAPALAKTEVRLDADGAARRSLFGWERRRWAQVRRVEELHSALLLSPYSRRHWLDATRALSLPVPPARRDELAATVRVLREAGDGAHA
jgi:hypothetical protein